MGLDSVPSLCYVQDQFNSILKTEGRKRHFNWGEIEWQVKKGARKLQENTTEQEAMQKGNTEN